MHDLTHALSEALEKIFIAQGLEAKFATVRRSDRPDLADFQCNGALAVAKALGRKPQEVAKEIADRWDALHLAEKPAVAGAGFLNFRITAESLSGRAQQIADDPRAGASVVATPRRVLVDYGGPNVAKEMHVGHLRASIIGEAIKRIYRCRGDETVGDAHFGDWGFQMGLLIVACADADPFIAAELDRLASEPPGWREADEATLDAELDARISLADLDRLYPAAAARAKIEPDYRDRARRATAELQAGRFGHRLI